MTPPEESKRPTDASPPEPAPSPPPRSTPSARGESGLLHKLRFISPIIVLIGAVVVMQVLLGLREEPEVQPQVPYRPPVEVIRVAPSVVDHVVVAHGEVSPLGVIDLVPEVGGKVLSVSPRLRAGAFFSEGDVLATLDPEDFDRRVTIARAAVREAELARDTEAAQGAVVREEWESLAIGEASALARREPQLELAEARVEAARAQLAQAERDRARTEVVAPFDGRVLSEQVDAGQVVLAGRAIARVTRTDRAEVVLPVLDADLALLDVPLRPTADGTFEGPEVTLHAEFAGAPRTWQGRIRRVESSLDPLTRMVRLVAEVPNPFGGEEDGNGEGGSVPLPAGLFVEARIEGQRAVGVYEVPRIAWMEGKHLLVVDDEDRLEIRLPTIERVTRDHVIIAAGLAKGERVVVTPLETVVDGMRVDVISRREGGAP